MNASRLIQQSWPLALGLLALFLPWLNDANAALVLNAWDLAEWSSLHPLSRNADLSLVVSFGLRALPLFLLALILWRAGLPNLLRATLSLLVAVALLPPPHFFLTNLSDPNYRQQLMMSATVLIIGLASGSGKTRLHWLHFLLSLMAMLTAWVSLTAALDLHRSLKLEAGPGAGLPLFGVAMLSHSTTVVITRKGRSTRDRPK